MRRLAIIFAAMAAMVLACVPSWAQEASSLDARLDEYLAALRTLPVEEKIAESDFLISTCTTDSVRNHVAVKLYGYFINSPLMGDEAVAIHLTDEWFSTGKARFHNDFDLMNAKIFADFNRQSLIGCRAPALRMQDADGRFVDILGLADSAFAAPADRYRVLYFYAPDCAKCKVETMLLGSMLSDENFPVDFYAINSGDNREEWDKYRARFNINASDTRVYHFWDPSLESDFQRKYGVMQTPRMFLTGKDGKILGRGLDAAALKEMLTSLCGRTELEYGGKESEEMFGMIFGGMQEPLKPEDVKALADKIEDSTLPDMPDMFRQLTGDMLYYTSGKNGAAYKEGTLYIVEDKILSRPEIWQTNDDSVKVVAMAGIMKEMLSKAKEGQKFPKLKIEGKRLRVRNAYFMVYSSGCSNCRAELAALENDPEWKNAKVVKVNLDELMDERPDEAYALLEAFDLSILPYIIRTDRRGVITGRYLSFVN